MKDLKKIQNGKFPAYYQYIDNGSEDTVVFIHGMFSSSSIFRHFLKLIKKNIVLIELRGITYSKCKRPYLTNYVDDIERILKKENISKNITLIGYSLGCHIANAFAEKNSEAVSKVIMLAPVNKSLKEIGKKNLIRKIFQGLGNEFFTNWKIFRRKANNWPAMKKFRMFNMKLLKDIYKRFEITNKAPVIILTGKKDTFFNPEDTYLNLSNILIDQIDKLDHFLFINKQRIEYIASKLQVYLAST